MGQYGPSATGAYCRPVYGADGNISGFVCEANRTGRRGEQYYSGARPGSWGPSGPFWPVQPNNPAPVPSQPLPPTSGQPTVQPPNPPPAPAPPPVITPGPGDSREPSPCGESMAIGGTIQLNPGKDNKEVLGGPNVGNMLPMPVYISANPPGEEGAWSKLQYTLQPNVVIGPRGIDVWHEGTADGNVVFAPPELIEQHLFGDGVLPGAKWPGKISTHGLMMLSGARGNSAHGDGVDGIYSIGLANPTSRLPKSGWYWGLNSDRDLCFIPTDSSSADADNTTLLCVHSHVYTSGYIQFDEISEPSDPDADRGLIYAYDENGNTRFAFKFPDGNVVVPARDNYFVCKNLSGGAITKGQVVYISGAVGASGAAEVDLAQADDANTAAGVFIAMEDGASNALIRCMKLGHLRGIDTSSFSEGDILYLSAATPGAMTATPPSAPNLVIKLGAVIASHAVNGSMAIDVDRVSDGTGLADPGSNGILVRTALNTTTARSLAAGVAAGIGITNADGTAGNPTISFDYVSLNAHAAPDTAADVIAWYDDSGGLYRKMTFDQLGTLLGSGGGTDLTGLGTDNTLARWDGTDTLQDSGITVDDSDNVSGVYNLSTNGETDLGANPVTIAADQNDYTGFQSFTVYNLDITGADRTLTGIVPVAEGQVLFLYVRSTSSFGLYLANQSGSSSAGNLINTGTGADMFFPPGTCCILACTSNGTDLEWMVKGTADRVPTLTAGAPSHSAPDGSFAIDTSNNLFYARLASAWDRVAKYSDVTDAVVGLQSHDGDLDALAALASTGILARTASDTYALRTLTASSSPNMLGVTISNGNGVSGNPTVGFGIDGLSALTAIATADSIMVFDFSASENKKITPEEFLKIINSLTADASPDAANDYVVTYDASAATVKKVTVSNLLGIGTTVQAYDADLTTWAGLTPSANAQSLVTAADYAAMRALLDLEAGVDFLAYSAFSANGISLVGAANYAAMRTLLDLEAGTDFPSLTTFNAHASRHQHGGADEIATATPGANAIPKAGAGGQLAIGFLASGTPDGTKFVRDDGTLAVPSSGGTAATQSDQETGTSTTTYVSPGRQQYHASAAKWWAYVKVSAGTPSITVSYNVTSITDEATGRLGVTIATDFSSADWCAFVTPTSPTGTADANNREACVRTGTYAAGSISYICRDGSAAQADPVSWNCGGFGDQ